MSLCLARNKNQQCQLLFRERRKHRAAPLRKVCAHTLPDFLSSVIWSFEHSQKWAGMMDHMLPLKYTKIQGGGGLRGSAAWESKQVSTWCSGFFLITGTLWCFIVDPKSQLAFLLSTFPSHKTIKTWSPTESPTRWNNSTINIQSAVGMTLSLDVIGSDIGAKQGLYTASVLIADALSLGQKKNINVVGKNRWMDKSGNLAAHHRRVYVRQRCTQMCTAQKTPYNVAGSVAIMAATTSNLLILVWQTHRRGQRRREWATEV